jgi:hypothetical protein
MSLGGKSINHQHIYSSKQYVIVVNSKTKSIKEFVALLIDTAMLCHGLCDGIVLVPA